MHVSVVICTHNPHSGYLSRTLAALGAQSLPKNKWELIVIDNASTYPVAPDFSGHPSARFIREEKLGLAHARLRGIMEARGELLVFVDDDNILSPDYLEQAAQIGIEWPILGVWGAGIITPEFEIQPGRHLQNYLDMLALRNVIEPRWTNIIPCVGARPWGAGLCARANVALAYKGHFEQSVINIGDRTGAALSSGGDIEFSFMSCNMGFGVGIFPNLTLIHLIPKDRLNDDYFVRLAEGTGTSAALLEYKWQNIIPAPPSGVVGSLRILKNILARKGVDRRIYLAQLRARSRAHVIIRQEEKRRAEVLPD